MLQPWTNLTFFIMFHWKCEREIEREDGHTLHHHRAQLGAIQREEALGWSITFISTTTFTHLLMKYGIFLHGEPLVFKPLSSYYLGSWETYSWEGCAFILTSTIIIRRHMEMLMLLDGILVLRSLSCKRQRISVLYAREGIGDIVYSDRQSQLHMDLEVYMREDDDHRGLCVRL